MGNIIVTANDLLIRLNGEQVSLERLLLFIAYILGGVIVEQFRLFSLFHPLYRNESLPFEGDP